MINLNKFLNSIVKRFNNNNLIFLYKEDNEIDLSINNKYNELKIMLAT